MIFQYNRNQKDLIEVLKDKAEKKNIVCKCENNKIMLEQKIDKNKVEQSFIPVIFKGNISEKNKNTVIIGKFTYGFYLTTLVVAAIVLIVLRLVWSIYKTQVGNIVLCFAVTILLIIVCAIVNSKGKPLKNTMVELLSNLDRK